MGFPFAVDGGVDVQQILVVPLFHALDGNGDAVGDFVPEQVQDLFPDHLCHDLSLRLVCYGVLIVEHRSVWQVFQNARDDILCVLVAQCRAWNDFIKFIKFAVGVDRLEDLVLVNGIDLVDHKDDRQM